MLAPGGLLCFRDYALYDAAQLRAKPENVLSARLHVRGDGTLAYYFDAPQLRSLLAAAGFRVLEVEYCTVRARNHKLGTEMSRVWLHAKAVNPLSAAAEAAVEAPAAGEVAANFSAVA